MPLVPVDTDELAWLVVGTFTASVLLDIGARPFARTVEGSGPRLASALRNGQPTRAVGAVAWVLFAAFWLVLTPHFAFEQKSYVEGLLAALAVPACLYTALLLWRGRDSLLVLTRAVAFMGVIYLPFQTIPIVERVTVEMVTRHTEFIVESMGYSPQILEGDEGYRSVFRFTAPSGHRYETPVLLACSGIGSISVVSGLILAVRAPLGRKLAGVAIVVPLIYGLNLVRATFIVLAHGEQWFHGVLTEPIFFLFATTDPRMTSYYLADRVISQVLSVFVLVAITWGLLYLLPNLTTIVEEVAYLATGREIDLGRRFRSA